MCLLSYNYIYEKLCLVSKMFLHFLYRHTDILLILPSIAPRVLSGVVVLLSVRHGHDCCCCSVQVHRKFDTFPGVPSA